MAQRYRDDRSRDEQQNDLDPGYWSQRTSGRGPGRGYPEQDYGDYQAGDQASRQRRGPSRDDRYGAYGGSDDYSREAGNYRGESGRSDYGRRRSALGNDYTRDLFSNASRDFGNYPGGHWQDSSINPDASANYGDQNYGRGREDWARQNWRGEAAYGQDSRYGQGSQGGGESRTGRYADSQYSGGQYGAGRYGEQYSGPHRGQGPKGYQRSSERLIEDICERLTDAPDVDASEISVQCKNGVVTVEGSVPSRNMKHRVENIVDQCSGVKDVDNRLKVTASTSGYQVGGNQASDKNEAGKNDPTKRSGAAGH